MATSTEIERKYDVPAGFRMPDLAGVAEVATVSEPVEADLDATYVDTPDLRLAGNRITLRRRTGGHDAGWHLKRPAGGDRIETREPIGTDPDRVPEAIEEAIRDLRGDAPLVPVVRIRTRRLERTLYDASGRSLALVADDAVSTGTLREPLVARQWREVEVELVDGSRDLLDAVAELLSAAGARPAGSPSKLARALAEGYPPPDGETTPHAGETTPSTGETTPHAGETTPAARGLVTDYLRAQRDAVVAAEAGVRRGDPDALHDIRVAIRRTRATLRTFRPLFDPSRTEPLRDELRWLGGLTGTVRDNDVLAERLDTAIRAEPRGTVAGPVDETVRRRLAADNERARRDLTVALDGPRYRDLRTALDAVVATPVTPASRRKLRRLAGRAVERADRLMAAADEGSTGVVGAAERSSPDGDGDARLHEARKAYKRARYAVEVMAPIAGRPARKLIKRLTALQDLLGAYQDTVVAAETLRRYGTGSPDSTSAFSFGVLYARQQEAGRRILADLPRTRRRGARRKVRRWLQR